MSLEPNLSFGKLGAAEEISKTEKQSLQGTQSTKSPSFHQEVVSLLRRWFLATLKPFLTIIHVTFIYAIVILADVLIISIISWSFGSVIQHSAFAKNLLEGTQLLSAIGAAVSYTFHLISSLSKEAKRTVKVILEGTNQEENVL